MWRSGDPGVLRLEEVPTPTPVAGEAMVRAAAVVVSRTRDLATLTGRTDLTKAEVRQVYRKGTDEAVSDAESPEGL